MDAWSVGERTAIEGGTKVCTKINAVWVAESVDDAVRACRHVRIQSCCLPTINHSVPNTCLTPSPRAVRASEALALMLTLNVGLASSIPENTVENPAWPLR